MNYLKKFIVIANTLLSWIGTIPAFLLPDKLKGYRTAALNIGGLIVILVSAVMANTGLGDLTGHIVNLLAIIKITLPGWIINIIGSILLGAGNLKLREKTNTPIFVKENAGKK